MGDQIKTFYIVHRKSELSSERNVNVAVNTSSREPGSYSGRDKERFTSGGRLRKSYGYVILDIEHIRSILARSHLGIRNTSTRTPRLQTQFSSREKETKQGRSREGLGRGRDSERESRRKTYSVAQNRCRNRRARSRKFEGEPPDDDARVCAKFRTNGVRAKTRTLQSCKYVIISRTVSNLSYGRARKIFSPSFPPFFSVPF